MFLAVFRSLGNHLPFAFPGPALSCTLFLRLLVDREKDKLKGMQKSTWGGRRTENVPLEETGKAGEALLKYLACVRKMKSEVPSCRGGWDYGNH